MSDANAITAALAVRRIPLAERMWDALNPADGLCSLCHGSGALLCWQDGAREFWDCPGCGATGARVQFAAGLVGPGVRMRGAKS